jgi:type VI secretion system protein ImpA
MSVIDIDQLVQELSADEACGPDLEYDPEMMELNQEAAGKPEVQYGDTVTPAVPPEWKVVKKLSLSLFKRTRDLRVAIPLLRSLMALHGMEGAADGLQLIRRLLEERWDFVHPQLDPDDDMDPTMRVNALSALADGPTVVREFKDVSFIMLTVTCRCPKDRASSNCPASMPPWPTCRKRPWRKPWSDSIWPMTPSWVSKMHWPKRLAPRIW